MIAPDPNAIKIVREYQRLVLFRLGPLRSAFEGPGLVLIIPIIDRVRLVDLRELFLEIPHQAAITEDNATISIDFIIFYKVVDAQMSVLTVQNFAGAAQNIAATTLRSVVGDMTLDDVLSKREEMNLILRAKLDEVTERWGVKVTQRRGPRDHPAAGRAGGDDPADVGRADPARRRDRGRGREAGRHHRGRGQQAGRDPAGRGRAAGGDPSSRGLLAGARRRSSRRAQTVDANTMSLQYLETLKQIGSSPSTKFVIPMEFTNLLSAVVGQASRAFGNGTAGGNGKSAG